VAVWGASSRQPARQASTARPARKICVCAVVMA
jgi:hypothetical protein